MLKKIKLITFIITLIIVVLFHLDKYRENRAKMSDIDSYYTEMVMAVTGAEDIEIKHQLVGEKDIIFAIIDKREYLIDTSSFGSKIIGYGGPIILALHVNEYGYLKGMKILRHYETPRWITKSSDWMDDLIGINLFSQEEIIDIDTLTGATYTTRAIKSSLLKTSLGFEGIITDGERMIPINKTFSFSVDIMFVISVLFTIIALYIRVNPKRNVRTIFMIVVVITSLFFVKMQFSSFNIISLLSLQVKINSFNISFFFYLLLPIVTLFWGNIYCGYLCPFGLLQELIGDLFAKFRSLFQKKELNINPPYMLTNLRFLLLSVMIICFFLFNNEVILNIDILRNIFVLGPSGVVVFYLILAVSLFIKRVWCRFFCPVGFYLAFLNWISQFIFKKGMYKFKWIRVLHIIPRPKSCDLGINSVKDVNCCNCDRCRY